MQGSTNEAHVERHFPLAKLPDLFAAVDRRLASPDYTTRRNALSVALGLHGMRVGEIVIARTADFHPHTGQLVVEPFKRGNRRVLKLEPGFTATLASFIETRPRIETDGRRSAGHVFDLRRSAWLLPSTRGNKTAAKRFQTCARELFSECLGLHNLTFHSLRHTCATDLINRPEVNGNVYLVAEVLGHRHVSSSMVYTRNLQAAPAACRYPTAPSEVEAREALIRQLRRQTNPQNLRVVSGDSPFVTRSA